MIEGNDSVLKHLASEREKEALLIVSPMARLAIKKEVLPQLEESVNAVGDVDALTKQTKEAIKSAFLAKSPAYTSLVSYKSIDQSDTQYLEDLLHVMDEWSRKTTERLEKDSEKDEETKPQEVTVKVEVESDINVKTDTSGPGVEVEVSKPDEPEEAVEEPMPYTPREEEKIEEQEDEAGAPAVMFFDLKDLRL
jgi:hypothetical protein